MAEAPALERLIRRDRAITLAGLALLCVLAWGYVVSGAGMGMSALEMTRVSLFPHTAATPAAEGRAAQDLATNTAGVDMADMDMPGMDMGTMEMPAADSAAPLPSTSRSWSPATWALVAAMWWIMMIAMMAPSATPAILLYGLVFRNLQARGELGAAGSRPAPTGAFAAGYLLIWLGFALLATAVQRALESTALWSASTLGSQSRWLSAGVLLAAGVYQLSPLKQACLVHCRTPASFLSRHWQPGARGALRLGTIHGAWCVGCCWLLMALLFVGGVMNLVWIAALGVLVLAEKLLPAGVWAGRAAGVLLIVWGVATLLV